MSEQLFRVLEENHGAMTLWEWTKEWIESENEAAADEHMGLVEYLLMRAGQAE